VPTPEDLMLQDLENRYAHAEVSPAFTRLYTEPGARGRMLANFHQRLNDSFGFLNYKAGSAGRHFNAEPSRDLITLIGEIRDAQQILTLVGNELTIDDGYREPLEECETFLLSSGGSPIPEGFGRIELVKWAPVFFLPGTQIQLREHNLTAELKMIGSGSYADVYRYTDPTLGMPIAVKRAKRNLSSKDLVRFRNEFDLLKSLSFPYLLQVFRYDEERNQYTMEHCDSTLRDFVNNHNAHLSFSTRKRIGLQFLYGLNYLHLKGYLHRDISLQNVLVKEYDYGAAVLKLSDFGLFKDRDSTLTRTESEIRGTIPDPTLSTFRDYSVLHEIHSIGFVLSFIFSGRQNIDACTGSVRSIIDKCVAYDHAKRYPDVRSIINDVEVLDPNVVAPPSEAPS
jgi:eukaryotic-like serine/threonine-protein kinase